jgi:hypothetical protein
LPPPLQGPDRDPLLSELFALSALTSSVDFSAEIAEIAEKHDTRPRALAVLSRDRAEKSRVLQRPLWQSRAGSAVGTPVARGPPRRSQRAALPHWAPALGHDAQALIRVGVDDSGLG